MDHAVLEKRKDTKIGSFLSNLNKTVDLGH